MRVRLANRPGKGHRRMPHHRLFDHRRVDVVPPPDDQILGATRDIQIAIGIQPPQIAGAQIAVVGEQRRVLVSLRIGMPGPHAGIADTNLAHFIHCAIAPAITPRQQDAHFGMRKGNADRPRPFVAIGRVDRHKTSAFGQAIAFDNLHAAGFFKAVEQLDGQGGRPRKRPAQTADVGIDGSLHQGRQGCRHRHQIGDLPAFDQLPQIVKNALAPVTRRRRKHDMRPRGDHRHQDRIGGKNVEQGQGTQHDVGFAEQQFRAAPAVIDHSRRAVLRDLGVPRRAASVEKCSDAISRIVSEIKSIAALFGTFSVEIQDFSRMRHGVFRTDQADDPGFGRR